MTSQVAERAIWTLIRAEHDTSSVAHLLEAIHLASNRVTGAVPWSEWPHGKERRDYLRWLVSDALSAGPELLELDPVAMAIADGLASTWEQSVRSLLDTAAVLAGDAVRSEGEIDSSHFKVHTRRLPTGMHTGRRLPESCMVVKNGRWIAVGPDGIQTVGSGDLSVGDIRAIAALQDGRSAIIILPELASPTFDTLPGAALWACVDREAFLVEHHRAAPRNGHIWVPVGHRRTPAGRTVSTGRARVKVMTAPDLEARLRRIAGSGRLDGPSRAQMPK